MDNDDDSWLYRVVDECEDIQQQLDGDVTDEQLCRALDDFETAAVVRDGISQSPVDVENTTAG